MSSVSSLYARLKRIGLDELAAVVGLLLALTMLPLRTMSSQIFVETIPILLGLGCLLYLLSTRSRRPHERLPSVSPPASLILFAFVLFALTAMVVLAVVQNGRSLPFMIVGGVAGALLLGQILLAEETEVRPELVLTELVLYGAVVRFAALYTTPGYVGIDIWTHMRYVELILQQGSLSAIDQVKYYASPLYHLLTVAAVRLLDASLRDALYLTLGLSMTLVPLFVYGTARLFVTRRWSLFAAALYVMGDHVIRWGIHLIPTSLGLLFFLACLYGLVRLVHVSHRWRDIGLLVFLSTAIVFTHQISAFITLVLIGSGAVAQLLMRNDLFSRSTDPLSWSDSTRRVSVIGLVGFDLGLIVFTWSITPYNGDSFLEVVLGYFFESMLQAGLFSGVTSGTSATASSTSQFIAELSIYVTTGGFLVLLFAGVIGCLTVLDRSRVTQATYMLVVAIVTMLFAALGLPLIGVENLVPGRWFAFLYAPLAVVGAIGLRHVTNRTKLSVVALVLLLLVLVYPPVMIASNDSAMDNPVFSSQHERLAYTEPELAAVESIDEVRQPTPGSYLHTDSPYGAVWERTGAYPTHELPIEDGRPVPREISAYRSYQSSGVSYFSDDGTSTNLNPRKTAVCPPTWNYIYANGPVTVCTRPTSGD